MTNDKCTTKDRMWFYCTLNLSYVVRILSEISESQQKHSRKLEFDGCLGIDIPIRKLLQALLTISQNVQHNQVATEHRVCMTSLTWQWRKHPYLLSTILQDYLIYVKKVHKTYNKSYFLHARYVYLFWPNQLCIVLFINTRELILNNKLLFC